MKTHITGWLFIIPLLVGLAFFAGCYTQLGTVREEQDDMEEYTKGEQEIDSSSTEENDLADDRYREDHYSSYNYDDSWQSRYRVGFSYYYPSHYWPSYAFSVAYANPWYYDYYWSYDPWWCGTPYVNYGYGYYNSPFYSYPFYSYYYGTAYDRRDVRHSTRDFGSTRGSGGRRGVTAPLGYNTSSTERRDYSLPSGISLERSKSGTSSRVSKQSVRGSSRRTGSQRSYTPRSGSNRSGNRTETGTRGSSSRGGSFRGYENRDQQPYYQPAEGNIQPPIYTPSRGGNERVESDQGNRSVGSSRGGNSSYTPSHTPTFNPPPPAPSGGSRAPDGGNRGSNSRGGRP